MNILLIMGRDFGKFISGNLRDELESLGDVTDRNGAVMDEDEYSEEVRAAHADIVVSGWDAPMLTARIAKANPQLGYLCNLTGTVRSMITREAIEGGIVVTNWGRMIGPTVAEAALLSILSCLRRTAEVSHLMHQEGGWPKRGNHEVRSLIGRSVGLHGFGNIARSLVKLLEPFSCRISAYDPYIPDPVFKECGVTRVTNLSDLYAGNDIISIHAPKIDETYHIVDAKLLGVMPDGGILVNTARGTLIDSEALVRELQSGRISASLDVYEEEPLPADSPFRGLLNCHLTPHTAGPTTDQYPVFGAAAIANIRNYIEGNPLENVVDVRMYDLMT